MVRLNAATKDAELSGLGTLAAGAEVIELKVPFLEEERHLVVIPL